MTVGEALKQMRLQAGLTQTEMTAGVVSESFYSKIERGVHAVDVQVLINILSAHHMDVVHFFSLLNFQKSETEPNFEIINQISFAQNKKDISALDKIKKELENLGGGKMPFYLRFRLENAYAWIYHSNRFVSGAMKRKIKSVILDENWNRPAYHYLSQAVVMLDINESFYLVKSAFKAYEKNKENDAFTLQFVALIAVNYLNCCYHQKADKEYAQVAIDFLKTLPVDPVIGFYRIIGTYYEAVFSNNTKIRDMIIEILKRIDYYSLIQDTVEDIKTNK